jgi:lipopolysaccharide export system protein LptA
MDAPALEDAAVDRERKLSKSHGMRQCIAIVSLLLVGITGLHAQEAAPEKVWGDGPLDFRCDNMQVQSKPNRTICRKNVVLRRADLFVCCDLMESFADDKWDWEKVICKSNVRALRQEDLVWADRAELQINASDLILTGKPKVKRGANILAGQRVIINVESDRARIEHPRAYFNKNAKKVTLPAIPWEGELPTKCPLPSHGLD